MQIRPAHGPQEDGGSRLPGDALRALRSGVRLDVASLLRYPKDLSLLLLDDAALRRDETAPGFLDLPALRQLYPPCRPFEKIEGRDFTPIEQSVIAKVVKIILSNLEDAWRPVHEIAIELLRSEINPQFATIVPPSDVVVVISFEVELENAMGTMVLALPYATIEPIS